VVLLAAVAACAAENIAAIYQGCYGGEGMVVEDRWSVAGARDVAVDLARDVAVLALGQEIWVVDIADRVRPRRIARIRTAGTVRAIRLDGHRLLAALGTAGLATWNLGDPRQPQAMTSLASAAEDGVCQDVAVQGGRVLLCERGYGLRILDLDRASPELGAFFDSTEPGLRAAMIAPGRPGHAYLVTEAEGVFALDLTDPAAPVATDHIPFRGIHGGTYTFSISFNDDLLYRAAGKTGLLGFCFLSVNDMSDPSSFGTNIMRGDGFAACRGGDGGANVVCAFGWPTERINDGSVRPAVATYAHASDGARAQPLALLTIPAAEGILRLVGDEAFLANHHGGLLIVDVSTPTQPRLQGSLSAHLDASLLAVAGDRAFIADSREIEAAMITGVDLTDLDEERPQVRLELERAATRLQMAGPHLGAVIDNDLHLFAAASAYPRLSVIEGLTCFRVHDQLLYGASQSTGVTIVDLADPRAPAVRGRIPFSSSLVAPRDCELMENVLYVATSGGIMAFDCSDPSAPRSITLGIPRLSATSALAAAGDILYLMQSNRILALDCSNPRNPTYVGSILADAGLPMVVVGDRLVVGDGDRIVVHDVTDPARPRQMAWHRLPAPPLACALNGDRLAVACGAAGLQVLRVRATINGIRNNAIPGRAVSAQAGKTTLPSAAVQRFDLSGRRLSVAPVSRTYVYVTAISGRANTLSIATLH